jgi:hypothetical protein
MYGEKRELMTIQCATCNKLVAMEVDQEDVKRHTNGLFVQYAFADRAGKSYLTPAEAEMWLSGVCGTCWPLLCPADPKAYS